MKRDELEIRRQERERCARIALDYASGAPEHLRGWFHAAAEAMLISPTLAAPEPEGMIVVDLDAFFSDAA